MLLPELVPIPADPPFLLGRTPVRNGEYSTFLGTRRVAAPPWWNDPDFRSPNQPVVGVTWGDAMAYCSLLGGSWRHRVRWSSPSARSSLPPDYRYSDYGFRVLKEGR